MNPIRSSMRVARRCCAFGTVAFFGLVSVAHAESLKIAYSDWPGWVAWEIDIQKDSFKEAGIHVQFMW
jgi:NitT/TauT family transport system substrate-binding protein